MKEEYRWHKISDGELPSDEEIYILHTKTPGTFTGWYHEGKWWKPGYSRYEDDEVIAWYNVPEFKDVLDGGYVDLGLPSGTLWADRNVGTETIRDNGDYFKFEEVLKQGNVPTIEQFEELINKCKWSWKGKGYEVIGPNGNSIYFPANGYGVDSDIYGVCSCGSYWSSSTAYNIYAYCLYFNRVNIAKYSDSYNNKQAVRLVK